MFRHFSYIIWLLVFTLPPIILMCRRYSDILWLNRKVVFIVTSAGVLYISILEPVAIYWKAWSFNSDKILGLYIGNLPIEEIVAAVFVYFAIACFIISRIARGK